MNIPESSGIAPSAEHGVGEIVTFPLAKGLGDRKIGEHLDAFRTQGMHSPRALESLFTLFGPMPATSDDLHLLQKGDTPPGTMADQLRWAYANPKALTLKQQNAVTSLGLFALDSIANSPQTHKLHGETRALSKATVNKAKGAYEAYGSYLQHVLDPDNPTSAKILDISGVTAKVAVRVSPLLLAAACGLRATPLVREVPIEPRVFQVNAPALETGRLSYISALERQAPKGSDIGVFQQVRKIIEASGPVDSKYDMFQPLIKKGDLDALNAERARQNLPLLVPFPLDYKALEGRTGYLISMGEKRGDFPKISGYYAVTFVEPTAEILIADMDPPPYYLPIGEQAVKKP